MTASSQGIRAEGPRFHVRTWREHLDPHGELWFARVVLVRPEASPFTSGVDDARACVDSRRRLMDAIRAAVARCLRLHFPHSCRQLPGSSLHEK